MAREPSIGGCSKARSQWRDAVLALGVLLVAGLAVTSGGEALAGILSGRPGAGLETQLQLAQSGGPAAPSIGVLAVLVAEPASHAPLRIRITPLQAIPARSFLRLRGLPPTASLSEGHVIAPGSWAVPLAALPNLTINLPAGAVGRSNVTISLVAEDGAILAEERTELVVRAPVQEKKAADPPAVPPRAERPILSPAERDQAEKLVARGERDLEQGNIANARQFFLRAAQAGLARAALLLATTYDPRELARLRAVGVQPNVAEARKWYERAAELGAPEAAGRLATLGGGG